MEKVMVQFFFLKLDFIFFCVFYWNSLKGRKKILDHKALLSDLDIFFPFRWLVYKDVD